jgi:hypothetical protein
MQASIISACKGVKVFKAQKQANPISEEEEERSHDSDEEVDEILFFLEHEKCLNEDYIGYMRWPKSEFDYLSCIRKIPIPPPKY